MSDLGFQPFDADNHYYEAEDAFIRHIEPGMAKRCMQWAEIDGKKRLLVGGKVNRFIPNPTFNPVSKPGALDLYFRGKVSGGDLRDMFGELDPISPAYRDRDARVALMREQGLGGAFFFPTLAVGMEESLRHDVPALLAAFRAFNRWIEEDWGFAYQDRIFAAPYLTLADPDWAVEELEWALDKGARVIVMRPAAAFTAHGASSPFAPRFDRVWGLLNEAGVPVVIHAGDSGNSSNGYAVDGFSASFSGGGWAPSIKSFNIERAAYDFVITSVFEKLFDRFPNLRMASVENGSEFLPDMVRKLRSTSKKMPGYFSEDPVDTFRRHWWINPFWEDDVVEVANICGIDRVLFGSDWPHIEGMPEPLDYLPELAKFDDDERRRILLDNVTELNTPRPA